MFKKCTRMDGIAQLIHGILREGEGKEWYPMPWIEAVGTALPPHLIRQDEAKAYARQLFADSIPQLERYLSVFDHAEIEQRYFAAPLEWFGQPHPFSHKNQLYVQSAVELGEAAIRNCLQNSDWSIEEVEHLILVSSTGLATPSLDAHLMNRLPLSRHVRRSPLWGLGCVGGAMGLSRAFEYVLAFPESAVLLVCIELCGLTFQLRNRDKSNLVATSLFADGAAAALITGDRARRSSKVLPGWLDHASMTWPHSLDVMGWKVTDEGLDVIFSREIPRLVRQSMREVVEGFLQGHTWREREPVEIGQLSHLIAHPGGKKVLEAYQQSLEVPEERLAPSRRVLRRYGNMSSPTVLFVLKEVMQQPVKRGELGLLFALGPGFSAEQLLLRWG